MTVIRMGQMHGISTTAKSRWLCGDYRGTAIGISGNTARS